MGYPGRDLRQGAKIIFSKIILGGGNLFLKKDKTGGEIFIEQKGGEDFFTKKFENSNNFSKNPSWGSKSPLC